jgi:predicted nuclease of predicted toxin-antitoxin system
MKILIDENLPKKLKKELSDFEIYSIQEMGMVRLEKW